MAEALGVVGAVASFVQLTDVSIRTCLYLYSFFSSLHKAQNEFQRHVIVLRDVHDAIQLIRQTTAAHSLSSIEELLLRKHLLSITQELSSLEKVTAGKDPAKLNVRLRWVMKSAATDRGLQELERRKTSLILLLQTITMRNLADSQGHQSANQTMLKSLLSLNEQQSRKELATRFDISTHFDRLSIQMESNIEMYKESLNTTFSTLTRDRKVTLPEENMEQVLRRVLDSYILPRVQESFTRTSEMQSTATLRLVQEVMGQATEQILSMVVNRQTSERDSGSQSDILHTNPERAEWRPNRKLGIETEVQSSPYIPPPEDSQIKWPAKESPVYRRNILGSSRPQRTKEWSYWTSVPALGTFRIQYGSQTGANGRFWTIQIDFWPSIRFLFRKCISLRYNNNYDSHGYMALFPSLAFYPIIASDNPIWVMIKAGNLNGVARQLQDNKNGPHDQDCRGVSLLMYAFQQGCLEVAQYLLQQGADPMRTTVCGRDSLYTLIVCTLNQVIYPRASSSSCHRPIGMDYSLFFSICLDLIKSGCDLADYDINIFGFLEASKFAEMALNQETVRDDHYWQLRDIADPGIWYSDDESIPDWESESLGSQSEEIQYEHTPPQASNLVTEPVTLDEDLYLADIHQVAQFLRCQGLDLVRETSQRRVERLLENPTRMTFSVLRECGLNSNYQTPERDCVASILYHGLYCLDHTINKVLVDNLIDMISNGADIYDMELDQLASVENPNESGVMSPTVYAARTKCLPIWSYVLRRAGYNPDEVFLEDERRRREFRRLHGATSSAVEIEDPPSSALRRRQV